MSGGAHAGCGRKAKNPANLARLKTQRAVWQGLKKSDADMQQLGMEERVLERNQDEQRWEELNGCKTRSGNEYHPWEKKTQFQKSQFRHTRQYEQTLRHLTEAPPVAAPPAATQVEAKQPPSSTLLAYFPKKSTAPARVPAHTYVPSFDNIAPPEPGVYW